MGAVNKTIANLEIIKEANNLNSWLDKIELPENYKLNESDEYMGDMQLKYFQTKLIEWRKSLMIESEHTLANLKEVHLQEPDDNDRASSESETNLELRTRERYLKLITKIDQALERIKNKTYGYCEETGEEIGLRRLDARPIATLTVVAQEKREQKKKMMHEEVSEEAF